MLRYLPLILFALCAAARAHGISEADHHAVAHGGLFDYLKLGALHMVTGYDHLLFLFGVIFYLAGMKDILKFVTAFTLGHSLTLIAATYARVSADAFLIDAVIALSVSYKAFDNLDGFRKWLKSKAPPALALIFLFGLIHGFGLSTRLQELALPAHGFLARILCFNAGVELGQLAALAVLVPLLAGLRKWSGFARLGTAANALLLLAGLALCAWQLEQYLRHRGHAHGPATHSHEAAHPHGPEGHGDGAAPAADPLMHDFEAELKAWEPATLGGEGAAAPTPETEADAPHDHGDGRHSH